MSDPVIRAPKPPKPDPKAEPSPATQVVSSDGTTTTIRKPKP